MPAPSIASVSSADKTDLAEQTPTLQGITRSGPRRKSRNDQIQKAPLVSGTSTSFGVYESLARWNIVYLEGSGQFGTDEPSDEEVNTVLDYIEIHGGGAYITSEFLGYLNTADYTSVNRFMQPMGVEAKAISLNWGGVNGEIEFECFPPVPE